MKPVLPYDRIMGSEYVEKEKKMALKIIHYNLDLYDLKRNTTNCQRKLENIRKEKMKRIGLIFE